MEADFWAIMLNISQKGEIYFCICILLFANGNWGGC